MRGKPDISKLSQRVCDGVANADEIGKTILSVIFAGGKVVWLRINFVGVEMLWC